MLAVLVGRMTRTTIHIVTQRHTNTQLCAIAPAVMLKKDALIIASANPVITPLGNTLLWSSSAYLKRNDLDTIGRNLYLAVQHYIARR